MLYDSLELTYDLQRRSGTKRTHTVIFYASARGLGRQARANAQERAKKNERFFPHNPLSTVGDSTSYVTKELDRYWSRDQYSVREET
ncbi:hypothetical protein AVEN_256794-1 [Araneus ventricosus]|uniref:Uncharacterized protein n=1 Tax=Araneus ventricosus TaxID=182803 RepID=A0A4Y2NJ62_ARAVE|nr:hypothetical protein AVEN_256794-1 [Araneus ventricosus]